MPLRVLIFCCFLCLMYVEGNAQTIVGEVCDMDTKAPVKGVNIENIYTGAAIFSDSDGRFIFFALSGQLVEFKKAGYKTVRVRIPHGYIPPYFKIIIQKGSMPIPAYDLLARHDYKSDSIYFHELYKHQLDFPTLSGLEAIQHPFSALSKKNQEIWNFQEDFSENQAQKYIDFTFSPKLITSLTGLTGDSLQYYMRKYRPGYQQLRNMGEYNLYSYIKRTVQYYRDRANVPQPNPR